MVNQDGFGESMKGALCHLNAQNLRLTLTPSSPYAMTVLPCYRLFVLMGLFSILCGLILALFLPDSVSKPRSFFLPRRKIFSDRELHILKWRVLIDDPKKGEKRVRLGAKAIKAAVSDLCRWRNFRATIREREGDLSTSFPSQCALLTSRPRAFHQLSNWRL